MQTITEHQHTWVNKALQIDPLGEPGEGGAHLVYSLQRRDESIAGVFTPTVLVFQNGDPAVHGLNGITNEALLAIVANRLVGFQNGPFACDENERALSAVRSALDAMISRSKDRTERGVEGQATA